MVNSIDPYSNASASLLRNLHKSQLDIERTLERLSTGLRVNRAADDPFGITRIGRTQGDLISNRQAQLNNQQSSLMAATGAEGARAILSQLQRMREIALASLNDSNTDLDRNRMQLEFSKLSEEIDRIARGTEYNGRNLLDGSLTSPSYGRAASFDQVSDRQISDPITGLKKNLFSTISLDGDAGADTRFQFRLFNTPGSNTTGLEIASSSGGILATYADFANAPTSLSLSLNGSGGPYLRLDRTAFSSPLMTPLTGAELDTPLQDLVASGRIDAVTYGNLALTAGGQVFSSVIDVQGSTTLNQVLTAINGLSNASGTFAASYDTGTGKVSVGYTGTRQASATANTSYTPGIPGAAGGAFDAFALITAPPQGPAYRDPTSYLPASGFAVASAQSYFPSLPGSVSAAFDLSGSNASLLSAFGIASSSNRGTVTGYNTSYYGETVATGGQSEYVNRTRLTIDDVTAEQTISGITTSLGPADLGETFRVLNTAVLNVPSFGAGDFSIDFGSNGVFTYAGFDPTSDTIQDVVGAINTFGAGVGNRVSATLNPDDTLTISNTPAPATMDSKVDDPGLGAGGSFSIDFGSNGSFSYNLQPGTSTISDFVAALNAHTGVSASFDASSDQLSLSNTVTPTYQARVTDPGLSAGTFSIDFGSNGVFNFAFNPASQDLQDLIDGINGFKPGFVSASYDAATDRFSISNTANPVTEVKAYSPTALAGNFTINFGENGNFSFNFDPSTHSIQSVVNAINAFKPGFVSATYDEVSDQLNISNTSSAGTPITASKVANPPLSNGTFSINFGSNGVFTLTNPQTYTIQGVVDALNAYGATRGGRVTANYDVYSDKINISNMPVNVTVPGFDTKINNLGLGSGLLSIDFGINGILNLGSVDGNAFSINDLIDAINNYTALQVGGDVSAFWDDTQDRVVVTNVTADVGIPVDNGIRFLDLGTGIKTTLQLNDVLSTGYGTQVALGLDIDKGYIDADLNINLGDLDTGLLDLATDLVSIDTVVVPGNNQISIFDGGTGTAAFFKISSAGNTGTGTANIVSSSADIDRSGTSALLDINALDVSSKTLSQLATEPIAYSSTPAGSNQISFGGSSNLQSFFRLSDRASTGTGGSNSALSAGDIDKSSSSGNALLDISASDVSSVTIGSLQSTSVYLSGGNNSISFSGGTGLEALLKLSNVTSSGSGTRTALSSSDIDRSSVNAALDIGSGDVASLSFQNLISQPVLTNGGDNNAITFSVGLGERVRDFFKLNDRPDNSPVALGTASSTQTTLSSAAIDNGGPGSPYDITAGDVSAASFQSLITPFATGTPNNQILIGGVNGANIRNLFNLLDVASDGSFNPRLSNSTSPIDNGSLDASLELDPGEISGNTIRELSTPRLGTLVSGALVIDGGTVLNIDPDTTTLGNLIDAINAYSGPSNKRYTAALNAGRLEILVSDTEALSASAAPAAVPGEATPRVSGNALIFDSAAYVADDAPKSLGGVPLKPSGTGPAEQAFAGTTLDGRYSVSNPAAPADISGLSFGGASNLASVLRLGSVASGSASAGAAEYQGVISATGVNRYNLAATTRQSFTASSTAVSSDSIARSSAQIPDSETGVVTEIQVFALDAPVLSDRALTFQYGRKEGNSESFGFSDLTAETLGIEGLSLTGANSLQSRLRGNNALRVIDRAIDDTLDQISRLGIYAGSMERQAEAVASDSENLSRSLSDWQDTDMATEVSSLTRQQLTAQAATVALAESQRNDQLLFSLLFGSGGLLDGR